MLGNAQLGSMGGDQAYAYVVVFSLCTPPARHLRSDLIMRVSHVDMHKLQANSKSTCITVAHLDGQVNQLKCAFISEDIGLQHFDQSSSKMQIRETRCASVSANRSSLADSP